MRSVDAGAAPHVTLADGVRMPHVGFGVFQVPPDEVVGAVLHAVDAGYRLVDTASVYGNEAGVGEAVARSGLARGDLFVTTKLWNDDQGHDAALRAFDRSMGRLGLDVLDQYLIHWPRPALGTYPETWRALVRLRDEGRVRSIGVSNFDAEQIRVLVAETGVAPAVNQVELHPGHPQAELRAFHAAHGIRTQAWSPIGRGQGLLDHPVVTRIARGHGRTPAQVVLRWHVQHGVVALPKSTRPERIRSNIDLFDFELSAPEMAVLDGMDAVRVGPDPATVFDIS